MKVNETEREVWTDAYKFFADNRGMQNTLEAWENVNEQMADLFVKHQVTPYSEAILTGAYKALQVVVMGLESLEGLD